MGLGVPVFARGKAHMIHYIIPTTTSSPLSFPSSSNSADSVVLSSLSPSLVSFQLIWLHPKSESLRWFHFEIFDLTIVLFRVLLCRWLFTSKTDHHPLLGAILSSWIGEGFGVRGISCFGTGLDAYGVGGFLV